MEATEKKANHINYSVLENGIVVRNYCAAELPSVAVEIKSGRSTYRFTGRYDGCRAVTAKLLGHMAADGEEKR